MREGRPRLTDPHPHTPQVLWRCFSECAQRTQTHRISVWPWAEPIGRDKAGLIALSSASQREAFSTWTTDCVLCCASHLSANLNPRDLCLLFLSISVSLSPILSLWPTPSVHHRPHQQQDSLPPLSVAETSSLVCTSTDYFLFLPVVMCSARCASSPATKSHQHTRCLFPLFPSGSGWLTVSPLSQQCADTSDKKPSLPLSDPNRSVGCVGQKEHPSWGAASKRVLFDQCAGQAGSAVL